MLDSVYFEITEDGGWMVLVHGDCPTGADAQAQDWADEKNSEGFDVFVERHPAKWKRFGKRAGPIRNSSMVEVGADYCLAFVAHHSKGAADCLNKATLHGINTCVFRI